MKKFSLIILSLSVVNCLEIKANKKYNLTNESIDLVMPCHEKDVPTLNLCIEGARKNIENLRRIIVVSERQLTDQAEWFPESAYPFNKKSIALEIFKNEGEAEKCLKSPKQRMGWVFKQITNLYHIRVIPDISANVLVIDCDTIFLRPVSFIDENTYGGLYCPGTENHKPYFEHAERCLPGFRKVFTQYSGISHHMLFQKDILEDMLQTMEKYSGVEAWRAYCRAVDINHAWGSPSADYELYFNFAFYMTDQVKIRDLQWKNVTDINPHKYFKQGLHFCSCHHYMRQ